jgi:hypothetical protein
MYNLVVSNISCKVYTNEFNNEEEIPAFEIAGLLMVSS